MPIIVCLFLLVKNTILVALNVTAVSQTQDRFLIDRGATDHKSHSSDPLESQIIFPVSKCALSPKKKVINSFYEITCAILFLKNKTKLKANILESLEMVRVIM